MSFLVEQLSKSRRLLAYEEIRPHHVIALYGLISVVSASPLVRSMAKRLLNACSGLTEKFIPLIQAGLVPDSIIRWGIRLQLKNHLHLLASEDCEAELCRKASIVASLRDMPIAVETTAANEQHYEVPAEFYSLCLVRWLIVLARWVHRTK
jgi:cyclopropane-fatty-acyl-phospholipid synthase